MHAVIPIIHAVCLFSARRYRSVRAKATFPPSLLAAWPLFSPWHEHTIPPFSYPPISSRPLLAQIIPPANEIRSRRIDARLAVPQLVPSPQHHKQDQTDIRREEVAHVPVDKHGKPLRQRDEDVEKQSINRRVRLE